MKKILAGSMLAVLFAIALPVSAASTYSLVEDAVVVPGGNPGNAAQIRSDASIAPSYGGVSVVLDTPINWTDLNTLSSDFNVTDDSCGGGSPRIQIRVDTDNDGISNGSVRVAFGPSPSFAGCTPGWQSTGNLISNSDTGRYDYSVFGGSPFTTYANAPANVLAGKVIGVFVVVDGSWNTAATGGDSEQTTLVDNITLNSDVTTFDAAAPAQPSTKDDCKKSGWKNFVDSDGNPFKNQGQCVSYYNHQNKGEISTTVTFAATNSIYNNGPTSNDPLYATGPINFTWDSVTGNVTGGLYEEIYPANIGTHYFNNVVSGTVLGGMVHLDFVRTVPNNNSFSADFTLSGNTITGTLAGPYYFTATGTITP
jgi:hypothetical protein